MTAPFVCAHHETMIPDRTQFDEKLAAILTAAAAVFSEKGYHNASIREIARASGFSLAGLYYYFSSKEELLYLVQDHALEELLRGLEERLTGVHEPEQRLRILIDNQLTYFVSNMAAMKVLSHEATSLKREYRERLRARKRRITAIASEILREIQPRSDFDARVATFALFGMMNWIYNWYRPGRDVPVNRLVEDITSIFLGGYAGPAHEVEYGVVPGLRA